MPEARSCPKAVVVVTAPAAAGVTSTMDSELLSVLHRYPLVGRARTFNLIALAERLGVSIDQAQQRVCSL